MDNIFKTAVSKGRKSIRCFEFCSPDTPSPAGPELLNTSGCRIQATLRSMHKDSERKTRETEGSANSQAAGTHYTMQQSRHESVGDFAHRFCETQHELEKLIPKVHGELELIYAFIIKLREDILRDLISREITYTTLQSLITVAQHYQSYIGQNIVLEKLRSSRTDELSQWQPRPTQAHATMHTGTVEKPIHTRTLDLLALVVVR